jgi:hypothetical protein
VLMKRPSKRLARSIEGSKGNLNSDKDLNGSVAELPCVGCSNHFGEEPKLVLLQDGQWAKSSCVASVKFRLSRRDWSICLRCL